MNEIRHKVLVKHGIIPSIDNTSVDMTTGEIKEEKQATKAKNKVQ